VERVVGRQRPLYVQEIRRAGSHVRRDDPAVRGVDRSVPYRLDRGRPRRGRLGRLEGADENARQPRAARGRRRVRDKSGDSEERDRRRRRQRAAGEAESDRNRHRDARRGAYGRRREVRDDHLASFRRDRGLDDCRPRSRDGGRADQNGIGEPQRQDGKVQPAPAHRRRARGSGPLRGPVASSKSEVGSLTSDRLRTSDFRLTRMYKLVLLRHGESTWNKENRFTGWTDVDLSERGREEAREAGRLLKEAGYQFDVAFTSVLTRAIRTLGITLDVLGQLWIPVTKSWRLNERHYGALQRL